MKTSKRKLVSLRYLTVTLLATSIISCNEDSNNNQLHNNDSIVGNYYGTAVIEEQFFRDGVMIFDTTLTVADELIVMEIDIAERYYHFELNSQFKTYFDASPLNPTPYYIDDKNTVWVGLDEFGYTHDDKKHWIFDPQQDTVYFRLARDPYGPTLVDIPDSIGYYHEEIHRWNYVLRAKR